MIRVMLTDDQNIVLQGIATLLELSEQIKVVGRAESGEDCLAQLAGGLRPDVILLDIHMPGMKGMDCLRAIQADYDIPVIFLTTFDDAYLRRQGAELGAKGLLLKNIALDDLVDAITRVAAGANLLSTSDLPHTEHMTPRENLIARALAEGKTNKEIARQQDLSPGTVKNYTSNLFSKLGVRNRAEAIVRLKELGLF